MKPGLRRRAAARERPISRGEQRMIETQRALERLPALEHWGQAVMDTVKDQLCLAIPARGLSGNEVARRIGMSAAYISTVLSRTNGRESAGLRLDRFLVLAAVIGVDPQDLLRRALAHCQGVSQEEAPERTREEALLNSIERDSLELATLCGRTHQGEDRSPIVQAALELLRVTVQTLGRSVVNDPP